LKQSYDEIEQARKILGLGERATLKEIKKAFRCQAQTWHPDKCKKSDYKECHSKMKEINQSLKILMQYIEDYNYSFAEEKVVADSPAELWKKQFGRDPTWGPGWE